MIKNLELIIMKAIYKYSLIGLLGATLTTACSDDKLDTTPSTYVGTEMMTGSASSAIAAIDGTYR